MNHLKLLLVAVLLATQISVAQVDLASIRADWQAHHYQKTYEACLQYRQQPHGRRLEVFYMAGTSLCRIEGREEVGRQYLDWILDNFNLDGEERAVVNRELQHCNKSEVSKSGPVMIVASNAGPAISSGSTKLYHDPGGAQPLRSMPIEVIRRISPEEFQSRLFEPTEREQAKQAALRRMGAGSHVEVTEHFVLVTTAGQTSPQLLEMGSLLEQVYSFFVNEYQMLRPRYLITVYLVRPNTMRPLADRLHGLKVSPLSIGYSLQDDMSMVGVVTTTRIGTLRHELFHLMVRGNFGDIPPWLDEGMAALYEEATAQNGRVIGIPGWRNELLRGMYWSSQPSVRQLVSMNWYELSGGKEGDNFDSDRQAAAHAKARCFMLYLQNNGKLQSVYQAFRNRAMGTTSADLLASTLCKDLQAVDSDFRAWFRTH